jgi:hypothetical protein
MVGFFIPRIPRPGETLVSFRSIVFARTEDAVKAERATPPPFLIDLRLDQILDAITASKEEYNLKPFFYASLNDIDAVKYRHEVFQDLENRTLFQHIELFAQRMRAMREYLARANKLYYKHQKERWFLDAVDLYCDSVNSLAHDLAPVAIRSEGLLGFRDYIANYVLSDRFTSLLADTKKLQADLSTVTYCVLINGNVMQVRKYDSEIDYMKFCYPQITNTSKEVSADEAFDLALAYKLISEKSPVVTNDFYLQARERIFVVSGPNQGGKTTFSRTFGQLHYLASIGCPVPGKEAQLFLFDKLFTHFEREENIANLRGKLQDDLVRIHDILSDATSDSIIIMNEIFTSTTLQDAIFLSQKIMDQLIELDLICVWVTFVDELASYSEQTVSMVSIVVPEDPTLRTYKIGRKPAEGLSYAIAIAEKYRLTYRSLNERIKT